MNGKPKRNGLTETEKERLFDDFLAQRLDSDLDGYLAQTPFSFAHSSSVLSDEDVPKVAIRRRGKQKNTPSTVCYVVMGVVSLLFIGLISYPVIGLITKETPEVTEGGIAQTDVSPNEIKSYPSLYLTSTIATLDYMDRHNISDIKGIYQESAQGISNAVDTYFPRTHAAFQRLQDFADQDSTTERNELSGSAMTEGEAYPYEWTSLAQAVRSNEVVDFYLNNDPIAKLATVIYDSDVD